VLGGREEAEGSSSVPKGESEEGPEATVVVSAEPIGLVREE
jgi:hypothetical protein